MKKFKKMVYFKKPQYFSLDSIQQIDFNHDANEYKPAFKDKRRIISIRIDFIGTNSKLTDTMNIFKFKTDKDIDSWELEEEFLNFLENNDTVLDWTIYR